ncbi:MAG TPA: proprotein convertase P-domain-containing protein, partial [Acidobacteriota bacterium]|nr:proprotein convertase P-domain-containing protein [Acidobacteriota bacterium]
MNRKIITLAMVLLFIATARFAQSSGPVYVSEPVVPTLTPAARDLPDPGPASIMFQVEAKRRDDRGIVVPNIDMPEHGNRLAELQQQFLATRSGNPKPSAFNTPIMNFAGYTSSSSPPDDTGDVGPDHFVQGDNSSQTSIITVWSKTGTQLDQFYMDDMGSSPCNSGYCDPIVQYDEMADRWMISEFDSSAETLCVYVSQTSDPTGAYYAYAFDMSAAGGMQDYPKYAVWPDGYYIGVNNGGYVHVLDRVSMLAGQPATSQTFTIPTLSGWGFQLTLPATMEGNPPPAGAPAIFARPVDTEIHSGYSCTNCDVMDLWAFHVDWDTPASSTITQLTPVPMEDWDHTLCGTSGNWDCMPQAGTTQAIDPIREPLHFPVQYRNWGSYETIVGAFAEDVDGTDHAAIHWFELRKVSGSWGLYQEGVLGGESGVHRSVAGIAMDGSGNIAVGYTRTGDSLYPSIYYSGRLSSDPLGTMPYYDNVIINATTSSTGSERWGDYAGMGVDPEDDCTFWFTTQYGGSGQTRIASFRFDACGYAGSVALDKETYACSGNVTITVSDASLSGNPTQNVTISSTRETTPETVVLTATPAGSATFVGTITLSTAAPSHGDGLLSVATGNTITVNYIDADDGAGGTNVLRQDTATVDCSAPVISNVLATNVTGNSATITWDTNENANSRVTHGTSTPPGTNTDNLTSYVTSHSVLVTGLSQCTSYYFSVTSADPAGNSATANNGGAYYTFTTGMNVNPTYASTDVPKAIPDSTTVTSTVAVTDNKVIQDVNVIIGSLTHTYDGDVEMRILSPGSTTVLLVDNRGSSGDNFTNTVFDDEASGSITAGTAPFTGSFRPEGTLSSFDGQNALGTWTLSVTDTASGDAGTLNAWSINFTYPAQSCGASLEYQSNSFTEACNGTGSGGGNGYIDPGEDVTVQLTLHNNGTSGVTGVTGTLSTSTTGVTVTDATASFPNIAADGTGGSISNHFSFRVDGTVACGTVLDFTIHMVSNEGSWDDDFSLTVGHQVAGGNMALWSESYDGTTFPPTGWAQVDVSGTAGNWARSTATVHPSGSPTHSGAGLAYFNSWTASSGSTTRLYQTGSTAIPAGSAGANVTLYMYHDTGYTTYTNEGVNVQVSTNGTTWTTVGGLIPRYDGSTGWKLHTVDLASYIGQSVYIGVLGVSQYGNDCHIDDISLNYVTSPSCTVEVCESSCSNPTKPAISSVLDNDPDVQ